MKPVINIADVELRQNGHGNTFRAEIGSFGKGIGLKTMGAMLHVVPPGKRAFPYHAHHVTEEVFIVLEGEGTYRFGGETYPIRSGDVLAAPSGSADVAHQIINTGNTPLKYLGISANSGQTDVVEYPDSAKFAVTSRYDWSTQSGGVRFIGRAGESLGYWDGEDTGDQT